MANSVARNLLLLILAMALGAALGTVTKFGLEHELANGRTSSLIKADRGLTH